MTAASITSYGFINKLFDHTVKYTHNNTHNNRVLSWYNGVTGGLC